VAKPAQNEGALRRSSRMRTTQAVILEANARSLGGARQKPRPEFLGIDELPHRTVVDLQTARCKLRNEPSQGEGVLSDQLFQSGGMLTRDAFGL
jgi:hypothetical protein